MTHILPEDEYPPSAAETFDPERSKVVLEHPVVKKPIALDNTVSAWRMAVICLSIFMVAGASSIVLVMYSYVQGIDERAHANAVNSCLRGLEIRTSVNKVLVADGMAPIIIPDCSLVIR